MLGESLDNMADFPFTEADGLKYQGPTLFVRGTKSQYVSLDTIPAIKTFFPNAQIADVDAGHWLISENPEAFRQGKYQFFPLLNLDTNIHRIAVLQFLGSS